MAPEENLKEAIRKAVETLSREDLFWRGVRGSVPMAVRHTYEAREMGRCPRNPKKPWHRCLQGTLAFIRMHSTMAGN